jgi:hypothetical protein
LMYFVQIWSVYDCTFVLKESCRCLCAFFVRRWQPVGASLPWMGRKTFHGQLAVDGSDPSEDIDDDDDIFQRHDPVQIRLT